MESGSWDISQVPSSEEIAGLLERRLNGAKDCDGVTQVFQHMMKVMWDALSPLIGPFGCGAIFSHARKAVTATHPLFSYVVGTDAGPDFSRLRAHLATIECDLNELRDTFFQAGFETFHVLSELAGSLLITAVLERLEEEAF